MNQSLQREHDRKPKPIIVVEYDPEWPIHFQRLQKLIDEHLGELVQRIEHVGSTSVPGLAAKPVIDMDVVIESRDILAQVIERLAGLGYVHKGDGGIPGRESFDREGVNVPRDGKGTEWITHHLYVCAQDSSELARHLFFRDYLRQHPEAATAYAQQKRELALRYHDDRIAYTEAKTEFVYTILSKAAKNEPDEPLMPMESK